MNTKQILDELDAEIALLQTVRDLLLGGGVGNGRAELAPKRPTLTPAARKRIGDAQPKRWAKTKKNR